MTTYTFPVPKLTASDPVMHLILTGPDVVTVVRHERVARVWTPMGCTLDWMIIQENHKMFGGAYKIPKVTSWTTPAESVGMIMTTLLWEFDRFKRSDLESRYGVIQTAWLLYNVGRLEVFKSLYPKVSATALDGV